MDSDDFEEVCPVMLGSRKRRVEGLVRRSGTAVKKLKHDVAARNVRAEDGTKRKPIAQQGRSVSGPLPAKSRVAGTREPADPERTPSVKVNRAARRLRVAPYAPALLSREHELGSQSAPFDLMSSTSDGGDAVSSHSTARSTTARRFDRRSQPIHRSNSLKSSSDGDYARSPSPSDSTPEARHPTNVYHRAQHRPETRDILRPNVRPADWPAGVMKLAENYNPTRLRLPYVARYRRCACSDPCRFLTCANALANMFCSPGCCDWGDACMNRPRESPKLALYRRWDWDFVGPNRPHTLLAAEPIEAGEVLGEYLGELEMIGPPGHREHNDGYMLSLKQRAERPKGVYVGVDATRAGGLLRFVNHSCEPRAMFHEVANGYRYAVMLVATTAIAVGEEITADYGGDLWFVCECGSERCIHRGL